MMKQIRLYALLIGFMTIGVVSCDFSRPPRNIEGRWRMTASGGFSFDLIIFQKGLEIIGSMTGYSADPSAVTEGPMKIKGELRGKSIWFDRFSSHRPFQVYTGNIIKKDDAIEMQGTFTYEGKNDYVWSASRL